MYFWPFHEILSCIQNSSFLSLVLRTWPTVWVPLAHLLDCCKTNLDFSGYPAKFSHSLFRPLVLDCSGYLAESSLIAVATLQFPFLSSCYLHMRPWFSPLNGSAFLDCHVNLHTNILDCLAPWLLRQHCTSFLDFFAFCTFFLISGRRFFCQATTVFSTCVMVNLEFISWLLTNPHKNQRNLLDDENENKDAESEINTLKRDNANRRILVSH
jgi:hypothetical protein